MCSAAKSQNSSARKAQLLVKAFHCRRQTVSVLFVHFFPFEPPLLLAPPFFSSKGYVYKLIELRALWKYFPVLFFQILSYKYWCLNLKLSKNYKNECDLFIGCARSVLEHRTKFQFSKWNRMKCSSMSQCDREADLLLLLFLLLLSRWCPTNYDKGHIGYWTSNEANLWNAFVILPYCGELFVFWFCVQQDFFP